jgi:hypothetical protein
LKGSGKRWGSRHDGYFKKLQNDVFAAGRLIILEKAMLQEPLFSEERGVFLDIYVTVSPT